MTKPGGDKYGITNGEHPLLVVVPTFSTKSIVQSTPVSGQTNTLTVTLTANYELTAGSSTKVTITELTGSTTATSASLAVTTCDGKLGTTGDWSDSGSLILTASSTLASNTECVITFQLGNPTSDQTTSPSVSVEAALTDGTSSIGSIAKMP